MSDLLFVLQIASVEDIRKQFCHRRLKRVIVERVFLFQCFGVCFIRHNVGHFVLALISFLYGNYCVWHYRTKSESDAVTVVGIVVIAVTVAVDIAEVVAIIVIRRAKPPVARHDKCKSVHNLYIKNRLKTRLEFL